MIFNFFRIFFYNKAKYEKTFLDNMFSFFSLILSKIKYSLSVGTSFVCLALVSLTTGTSQTLTSLSLGLGFKSWGRHPKGQINKWPHKTLRCPASPRRLKPRYPDTRAKKADVFVGTSFVCLALVSRAAQMVPGGQPQRP